MGQRADGIEADIAPKLQPNLVTDAIERRGLHSGLGKQRRKLLYVVGNLSRGLSDRKTVAIHMLDHAGRHDLGGGIDDASDGAFRAQFAPLPSTGVDALQRRSLVAAAVFVEIPIGNSVDRGNDAGSRPK